MEVMTSLLAIGPADVESAAKLIAGVAARTPLLEYRFLNEKIGGRVLVKFEGRRSVARSSSVARTIVWLDLPKQTALRAWSRGPRVIMRKASRRRRKFWTSQPPL